MKAIRAFVYLFLTSGLILTGCGGGGGGGGASTATIDQSNVADLAVAATEGMKSSATASETPLSFKTGTPPTITTNKIIGDLVQNYYATLDYSSYLCTTGSFLIDDQTGAATLTNCVISDGYSSITINGTMTITPAGSGYNFTANLTFTQNGNSETINASGTCDAQFNCSMTTSFTGIDGRTYTTANMSVSGNNSSGYSVSGTITDPDHGNITISTTTPVTFNCPDGRPDLGQITVTGDSSATVVFNNCSSFSVTFGDATTTYNWTDF